jgi:hypothetical protein
VIAAAYQKSTSAIRAHIVGLREATDELHRACSSDSYGFAIDLHFNGRHVYGNRDTGAEGVADEIIRGLRLKTWSAIFQRLNIRRLMASKRVAELDKALSGGEGADQFPEPTPDMIENVAAGYIASAHEFLEEAVAEEYDHWRPRSDYKRNDDWKINRKIIRSYTVDRDWSGRWRCNHYAESHVRALDNIFHLLAGLGPVKDYKGELASAIETTKDNSGAGETQFFKFKCYNNGNLHLEFRRQDLLDLFNQIASKRDRIGQKKGTTPAA